MPSTSTFRNEVGPPKLPTDAAGVAGGGHGPQRRRRQLNVSGGGSSAAVTINGGTPTTGSPSVTLSLHGTMAFTMELSKDPTFASSTRIPYLTSIP